MGAEGVPEIYLSAIYMSREIKNYPLGSVRIRIHVDYDNST